MYCDTNTWFSGLFILRGEKTMWSAMPKEHASMQTGKYQAIDKKVVYEFIIMTSNLTGIAVEKLVEPSYTAWTLQREQRV